MTNCIFEPRTDTSSATICKNCGQEKVLHNHNRQVPQLYTEEQLDEKLRKAIEMARESMFEFNKKIPTSDEIIQSLKQPKQ